MHAVRRGGVNLEYGLFVSSVRPLLHPAHPPRLASYQPFDPTVPLLSPLVSE